MSQRFRKCLGYLFLRNNDSFDMSLLLRIPTGGREAKAIKGVPMHHFSIRYGHYAGNNCCDYKDVVVRTPILVRTALYSEFFFTDEMNRWIYKSSVLSSEPVMNSKQ